jgi:hypothetical protein
MRPRTDAALTPPLVHARDVASLLRVTPAQIVAWRRNGTLRAFTMPGRAGYQYVRADVERVARRRAAGHTLAGAFGPIECRGGRAVRSTTT